MNSLTNTVAQPTGQLFSPATILAIVAFAISPLAVFAPLAIAPLTLVAGLGVVVTQGPRLAWQSLPQPLAAGFLAFVLFGALSALWAIEPVVALHKSGQLLFIFMAGLVLCAAARTMSETQRERIGQALLAGVILAAVLLAIERYLGMPLTSLVRRWPSDQFPLSWLNRAATLLAALSFPAAWVAHRRWGGAAAVALIGGTFVVVLGLKSNAAIAALMLGATVALIARRLPSITVRAVAVALVAVSLSASIWASVLVQNDRVRTLVSELQASAYHRLMIWNFTSELISERPVLGWGLDASRAVPRGRDPAKQPDDKWAQGELLPLHPHNAALQIRLELGLVGLLLILPLVVVPLWRAQHKFTDNAALSAALGSVTALAIVGLVSFGVWQSWWLCAIWSVIALCIATMGEKPPRAAGASQ